MSNYKDPSIKYKFAPLDTGAFFFPTDHGCHYTIYIKDGIHHLWNTQLFDDYNFFRISFDKKWCDEDDPGLDDTICNTIFHIITSNMISNGALGVYYHVWEPTNNDMFYSHFYDEMELLVPEFEAFEFLPNDENGEQYPVSLFIHKNNPDKSLMISEFKKLAEI